MSIKDAAMAQARAERFPRCMVQQAIAGIRFSEPKRSIPASTIAPIWSGPRCETLATMEGAIPSVTIPSKVWKTKPKRTKWRGTG